MWTQTYDEAGYNDAAVDVYVDASQNIYLAGTTFNSANSGYQVLILKYNSSGTLLWNQTYSYPGSLYNVATSITGDNSRIYIGGITYNFQTASDYLALSFSTNGTPLWNYTWNNLGLDDGITKIYKSGNKLFLAGGSEISPNKWIYAIINLNPTNGAYLSQNLSGGSSDGIDRITDIAKDAAGNIYVTGGSANLNSGYDFRTLKLDTYLNTVWSKTYNSTGSANDVANGLAVDYSGNVYVTGYSETPNNGTDYTTLKYNSSGTQLWVKTFDGQDNAADTAKAIILDQNQLPVITGVSTAIGNQDFYTLKYDAQGNEVWGINYNGISNGDDIPFDIAIDGDGAVIVSGQSQIGGSLRYASVKYSEHHITNPPDEEIIPSAGYFTKNSGQLQTTSGSSSSNVKFIGNGDYPYVYVQDDKLSYVFTAIDSTANDTVHRIDMVLNSRNKTPKMRAMDKMDFYQNYYLPTVPDERLERVSSYKKLVSIDAWDDIDFMLSHNNNGLKYYLICKLGFDPADIGWEYAGASSVSVNSSGDLVVSSSIGSIAMPKGEAYEVTSTGTRIDKSWQPVFNVSGADVALTLGTYNSANTLVIEIDRGETTGTNGVNSIGNMLWNSHYGSADPTVFKDVVTDNDGNIFVCGQLASSNFPVQSGQQIITNYSGGGDDAIVFKMSEDVVPLWLTYHGGSETNTGLPGNEDVTAITKNEPSAWSSENNRILICGYTNSVDLVIEDGGGMFDVDDENTCTSGDCFDGFIAEFDQNGTLKWSTYYGGDGDEKLFDISCDLGGTSYIVGERNDDTPLMQRSGASNYSNGKGLLLRYTQLHILTWANAWDGEVIKAVATDQNKNVFTTGATLSSAMPILNIDQNYPASGSINSSGLSDAYINKFNSTGELQFSFYWGVDCPEAGSTIATDDNNNLFVGLNNHLSYTPNYCTDLPVLNGFTDFGGQDDNILKISMNQTTPQIVNASYFGGGWGDGFDNILPSGSITYENLRMRMQTSKNGMLYIMGYTRSTSIATPGNQPSGFYVKNNITAQPFQTAVGDNYIAAYDQNMNLVWSTFHGSDKYDIAGGLSVSESNQRLVIVGTGNHGFGAMDVPSFDPEGYNISTLNDYFQAGPVIGNANINCGEGAIFDISQIDIPLSVYDMKVKIQSVKIWPNPLLNILNYSSEQIIEHILISDISGRVVYEGKAVYKSSGSVRLNSLSSGIYVVSFQTKEGEISEKFIKL